MNNIYITPDGSEFSTKGEALEYVNNQEKLGQEYADKRREFIILQKAVTDALGKMYEFQEKCEHPYLIIKPDSDTGNYSRSEDSYWYECRCKLCNDSWRVDSKDEKYNTYKSTDPNIEWVK